MIVSWPGILLWNYGLPCNGRRIFDGQWWFLLLRKESATELRFLKNVDVADQISFATNDATKRLVSLTSISQIRTISPIHCVSVSFVNVVLRCTWKKKDSLRRIVCVIWPSFLRHPNRKAAFPSPIVNLYVLQYPLFFLRHLHHIPCLGKYTHQGSNL